MGNRYRRVSLGRRGVYLLYRNCCRSSENSESRYRKVPSEKFSSISFIHGFCTPSGLPRVICGAAGRSATFAVNAAPVVSQWQQHA